MNEIKLTIHPSDTNYEIEVRSFGSRAVAQAKINELYLSRYINRKEWSRLFDELSEPGAGTVAVETGKKLEPQPV